MKKIIVMLSMCLVLFGCASNSNYERNQEMGTINNIDMLEVYEKMENKETFMFMLAFDFCPTCQWFSEEVLPEYIKNHGFEFNKVEISPEMSDEELAPVFQFIIEHPNPPKFLTAGQTDTEPLAPSYYFIVDGEVEEIFIGPEMDGNKMDEFVQKYQLDKVE